ncbi:hypothetical protein Tco_0799089 [Tanacetum coccineum]
MNICHHVEQAAAASTKIIENKGCVSTGFTDSFPMQNTTTPICEPSKVADETSKGTADLDVAMNKNPIQSANLTSTWTLFERRSRPPSSPFYPDATTFSDGKPASETPELNPEDVTARLKDIEVEIDTLRADTEDKELLISEL